MSNEESERITTSQDVISRLHDKIDEQQARIAELESQLAAIGAGGVEPLRKPAAAPPAVQAVPASVIAGAVFDFAGYLTTLPHKEAIHCSEAHEAAPMVEAITEWCKRRNLTTDGAKVETWRDHLAEAPAHPAEGVPAQAAVPLPMVELFGVKDGQETCLGSVPMPPTMRARELLQDIGFRGLDDDDGDGAYAMAACEQLIEYCKAYYEAPAHPAEGVPAQCPNINEPRGCWRVACQLGGKCREPERSATQPAAQGMEAGKLLAEKHTGMKVDYRGLLGQVQREIERSAPGHAEMLRQLQGHLQELGQRWYAGDTAVVDELLQLYCVERQARAALAAQAKQGGAA
ncbi:hypothetical protein N5J07_02570 [Comamonas aquatica]|uniref:hypothetical protein n=1 Tax=Comamonas aquatica TaxID=225991 RepID=UPI00244B3796|nr:hypothetical protein [Comamonas aquatica]MDH1378357.1 hypothetical protein [Comamonas aquatica]MDH1638371.1 hypothetical protein [Comamonas aquatica]